jgi:predicted nuclease of predicted toxin-antitoxin system
MLSESVERRTIADVRRKTFEKWQAEQRARYPGWDRYVRSFETVRGPKRKLPLLLDENLEEALRSELRSVGRFRVIERPPSTDDRALWQDAKKKSAVLVTSDSSDFWNDRKYPVHLSPAILILKGKTAEEKLFAFVLGLLTWRMEQVYRVDPSFMTTLKIKASAEGAPGKYWDGTSVVLVE